MEENKEPMKEEKAPTMIEKAQAAADKLKEENLRMERNLKLKEEQETLIRLGGQTDGTPKPLPPKEISPVDYAKEALKGKIIK